MAIPVAVKAKLKTQLIEDEGLELKPYLDQVMKTSIGVGRNLSDNGISPDEAMYLLENDLKVTWDNLIAIFGEVALATWTEARLCAILNMLFNLGYGRFVKFRKMVKAIREGKWDVASAEAQNSAWYDQVGKRAERIVKALKEG